MNTWYIYSPKDNDPEDGSRLMLDWGLSYEDALTEARIAMHKLGRAVHVADEWHDENILRPQMEALGMAYATNRRAADPVAATETLWTQAAARFRGQA